MGRKHNPKESASKKGKSETERRKHRAENKSLGKKEVLGREIIRHQGAGSKANFTQAEANRVTLRKEECPVVDALSPGGSAIARRERLGGRRNTEQKEGSQTQKEG